MTETDYYLARGRSLAVIVQYGLDHAAYYQGVFTALGEAGVEVGGEHTWYSSSGLFGGWHIELDEDVPPALRRNPKQRTCCVPNKKSEAGRVLAARLKELGKDGPTTYRLCAALCGQPWAWMTEGRLAYYGLEEFPDGAWVLSCPAGGLQPYDAVPLLRSEYWRMREARDAGKGAP